MAKTKYKAQFYPGNTLPAKNRRRFLDPSVKLEKLRDVPMDDVVKMEKAGIPVYSTVEMATEVMADMYRFWLRKANQEQ